MNLIRKAVYLAWTMQLRPFLFIALPLMVSSTQAQSWNWATSLLGTGQMRVEAVAALADGGAFVCGEFNDSLRTPLDTLVTHGGWDGFLLRLDNNGDVVWSTAIGSAFDDELNDIVVDEEGNGYAAATFRDTADWKGAAITGVGAEATLVKFDPDGDLLWYRRAVGYSFAYTVSVNSGGTAFLGGVINTSAVFSGTTLTNSGSLFNAFVIQYDSNTGALLDADRVTGSSGESGAYGMDVDSDGNVYITGYNRPQQNPYVGTFMAKVAFGSGTNWSVVVASAFGDLYGRDVSVANDGHVYFTGNIYNDVLWMGSPLGQYGRYKNAYLARFATDGTLDRVQQVGGIGRDEGLGVVADGLGHAYWTGVFTGIVDFDTVQVSSAIGITASQDVFVAYTSPAGGAAFVSTAGGSNGEESATAIDKHLNGPVIVGGSYISFQTYFDDIILPVPQGQRCFVASLAGPDDELTTPVAEHEATPVLQVYPVPANNSLFVAMQGARGPLVVSVFDQAGREVLATQLGAPFGTVDVSNLCEGVYIVRCANEEGVLRTTRLVVAH